MLTAYKDSLRVKKGDFIQVFTSQILNTSEFRLWNGVLVNHIMKISTNTQKADALKSATKMETYRM